jgi:hypothetical protein
MKVPQKLRVGK